MLRRTRSPLPQDAFPATLWQKEEGTEWKVVVHIYCIFLPFLICFAEYGLLTSLAMRAGTSFVYAVRFRSGPFGMTFDNRLSDATVIEKVAPFYLTIWN